MSVVCDVVVPYPEPRGLKFSAILLHHPIAYGLWQFVLNMHGSEK